MPLDLVNPHGLPVVDSHRQVSVATGSRLVFVAGQVAWDASGHLVGEGDLATQVEQCYLNVATALAGVGASFADVAKLTVYIVDYAPEKMGAIVEGVARASAALGLTPTPPLTGIGVPALAAPGALVEVEATAVIG
ncbi:RidA family protein [Blastococcus sp. BMG 814]|uniref:RidA family protein n=1 Tax=Blastococcus carthaginiensis TaxID=3050034 RepID=A0ABT9I693_9ACTN|nr:RidA family protein [Blastococcus carthaginiensis]MDP5181097.1 RidA family protein [Blastococcus carthaginiensis]